MQQTAQYWKPGEAKPRAEKGGSGPRDASSNDHPSSTHDGGRRTDYHRHPTDTEGRKESKGRASVGHRRDSSGGESKKREQKGKGKDKHANGRAQKSPPASTGKPSVTGPSQGLLAMKFMQRKVKVDEVQQQQREKREKLERDFSSSYAKRLKADRANEKERLVCRPDELDPALVLVGRRSFGGFNVGAEAAYEACVRDIAAGTRVGQVKGEGRDDEGGISDTEMAERLGKNVRRGGR